MSKVKDKVVLITGGTGFLGKYVTKLFEGSGCRKVCSVDSTYDLAEYENARAVFNTHRPNIVVHLAGFNGGIIYNEKYPADIYTQNTLMALNVYRLCKEYSCELISVISSCAYPDLDGVLTQDLFWEGNCAESIRCHGLAKRNMDILNEVYNKQYGTSYNSVIISNLFGPGDTFNLERTKVVGAVIRKVVEAKEKGKESLTFKGTGAAKRQFTYAEDAAIELYGYVAFDEKERLHHIASPDEISIKDLVQAVVDYVEYEGEIVWEGGSDGQLRKYMEPTKNFEFTPFSVALAQTIDWYMANKVEADRRD